ncbi:MAG TPA: kelch repeat-containing protein [Thermoplasmata archaeon]|nr:kelch repeat-containing protein [Thermoplasmata archaeon]
MRRAAVILIVSVLVLGGLAALENGVRSAASGPPGRIGHAMAYESKADRMVMFGGLTMAANAADTWSYDLETNTWSNLTSASGPSYRLGHAVAYDSESDRIVMFAGMTSIGRTNETWSYNLEANTWTKLDPATKPHARDYAAMAYDSASDRVILFGGYSADGYLADTWSYDLNTDTWTNLTPAIGPPARDYSAMAYDVRSDRLILFGGDTETGYAADTWSYDFNTNTWTNRIPATGPCARHGHAMAYDAKSDQIVLFGGHRLTGYNPAGYLADTWSYEFATNTWRNRTPAVGPEARVRPAMAYDSQSDRIVLFGGRNATNVFLADTWSYDLNTNTWTDVNAAGGTSVPPGSPEAPLWALIAVVIVVAAVTALVWIRRRRKPTPRTSEPLPSLIERL